MAEEVPLLKQTLRATAIMLLPTMLFLGLISAAVIALAPPAARDGATVVEADKAVPAAGLGDKVAPGRGARASARLVPGKF